MEYQNRPNNNVPTPPQNGRRPDEAIRPANPQFDQLKQWGTEQAGNYAKDYALGKAASIAAKTALGARVFGFSKWLYIAEWGGLIVAVGLTILSIVTIIQGDGLLGTFGLVFAAIALGVWFIVRKIRQFIDRQIDKAFQKFQQLLQRGSVKANDWPKWYEQNKKKV